MCHPSKDRPPVPPVVGEIDSTGSLELTSGDGATFAVYEAFPVGESRARVVILPDARGLHPYYRALAERFAEAGFWAAAIDWFGRTAGASMRDEAFDYRPHVQQLTPEHVRLDVGAAVRHVSPEGTAPVFTVGFCLGGGHSWRLAASDLGLAGAIGFYGLPSVALDVADQVRAPLLMLVAGGDEYVAPADSADLAERVIAAGGRAERHVYEGAPHSFFDQSFADHADACADAWKRLLGFVDDTLSTAGAR
jgi:carboxymethylenebutenolidase